MIGLDVEVQAPQEILVEGRGLDAEMGGDLHLGGTMDSPLVSGDFDLLRGNFSLAGNKLSFTHGPQLSFNGAGLKNKIDPTLNFTAQTTVGVTTVTLQITGSGGCAAVRIHQHPGLWARTRSWRCCCSALRHSS